jgi:hypothetical protein
MASQPQIRFCLKVRFREFREFREGEVQRIQPRNHYSAAAGRGRIVAAGMQLGQPRFCHPSPRLLTPPGSPPPCPTSSANNSAAAALCCRTASTAARCWRSARLACSHLQRQAGCWTADTDSSSLCII